jgi:WD40 repeat protein
MRWRIALMGASWHQVGATSSPTTKPCACGIRKTKTLLLTLDAHASWIKSIAYSNDGMTLAIGTDTGQVMVYDAETGDVLQDYALHNGAVLSLAFAPDDSKLASGGADETIQIYDMQTGDVLAGVERAGGPVRTLAH